VPQKKNKSEEKERMEEGRENSVRSNGDFNSIQFNSLLFTCKLNSPKANYKVCTGNNKNLTVRMTVYIMITEY
jgi:hypothetical protein